MTTGQAWIERRKSKKVDTLDALLAEMKPRWWNVSVTLHAHPAQNWTRSKPWLQIVSEGRHMSFSSDHLDVPPEIVKEAHDRGLIIGAPEWGGRKSHEWVLTSEGERLALEAQRAEDKIDAERRDAERIPAVNDDNGEGEG